MKSALHRPYPQEGKAGELHTQPMRRLVRSQGNGGGCRMPEHQGVFGEQILGKREDAGSSFNSGSGIIFD